MQTTQPNICPGMQQDRGSCAAVQHMAEHYVNSVASVSIPIAMTIEEVKQETAEDSTLQAVISLVRSNKWNDTT